MGLKQSKGQDWWVSYGLPSQRRSASCTADRGQPKVRNSAIDVGEALLGTRWSKAQGRDGSGRLVRDSGATTAGTKSQWAARQEGSEVSGIVIIVQ
jgi:hypothetical protein